MSWYVEDKQGNRRKVPDNYVLQSGEAMHVSLPLAMKDGAPGRIQFRDAALTFDRIAIGDAVATDTIFGMERITFADGTTATKLPGGGFMYAGPTGQQNSLSVHQQSHMARVSGSTVRQFADGYIDREASRQVAHADMEQRLQDGWRGTGGHRVADAAAARDVMVADLSNAWQAR